MTTDQTTPATLPQWVTQTIPPTPETTTTTDLLTLTKAAEIRLHYERFGYSSLLIFQGSETKPEGRLDVLRWMAVETAKALDVLRAVIAAEEKATP